MYSVQYDRNDVPSLSEAPPAEEFALDLERYPRAAEEVPGWFAAQLPGPARNRRHVTGAIPRRRIGER